MSDRGKQRRKALEACKDDTWIKAGGGGAGWPCLVATMDSDGGRDDARREDCSKRGAR